ncbi:tRNA (guanosine(37)-N1)-methyltransferase TrmD [Patescibacteria group bacterium]
MKIDILTLFPKMFQGPFDESIIKRAQEKKLVEINIHNLRDWTKDRHKTVDDRPYGGGVGMVMMVEPLYRALKTLKSPKSQTILLTPQGKSFNQKKSQALSREKHLILICGHYEGVDERVRKHLVDEEISIGDYVLTGGELPAMVLTDSITRLIPGVLKDKATKNESFSCFHELIHESKKSIKNSRENRAKRDVKKCNLLDFPQFTRPENFRGWKVPKILLSGDHSQIDQWRKKQSLKRTKSRRPDLLASNTRC